MAGRKKGAYQQSARVMRMLEVLRLHPRGMRLRELAEEFDVSEKQAYRDLKVLGGHGHDIQSVKGDGERTRYVLRTGPFDRVDLSIRERYALLAVRRVFDVLRHTPLYDDVRSIYAKITQGFSTEQRAEMTRMQDRFVVLQDGGTKLYDGRQDILNALMSGVMYRARVAYTYRNASGKTTAGVLEPYAIVLWRQGLYVVGKKRDADETRVFAVERFVQADYRHKAWFSVPEGFRIEDYFKGVFGIFVKTSPPTRVVVDFSARCADYVRKRVWHPEQTLKERPRGGVRLIFEVTDTTQVLPWVLSWGSEARLVEPASLVAEIARNGKELARRGKATAGIRRARRAVSVEADGT